MRPSHPLMGYPGNRKAKVMHATFAKLWESYDTLDAQLLKYVLGFRLGCHASVTFKPVKNGFFEAAWQQVNSMLALSQHWVRNLAREWLQPCAGARSHCSL